MPADLHVDSGVATRPEIALTLFTLVARMRAFELLVQEQVLSGAITGFWHPGLGQEGLQAGAIAAMGPDDFLFYSHRGMGYGLARGIPSSELFADLLGRVTGSARGKGGGTPHYFDAQRGVMGESGVLGGAFTLGAGAALAAHMTGSRRVAVVFFGDGAAARGPFHEALLQAAVWRLPLVLICENNGIALSTPFSASSPTPNVADRAAAYGISGHVVDGQAPLEVYDTVSEAIAHARAGNGPVLVEGKTERLRGHYEGDRQQYRHDLQARAGAYVDPLEKLRPEVEEVVAAAVEAAARSEMADAFASAHSAPSPGAEVIFEDVYGPPTTTRSRQDSS